MNLNRFTKHHAINLMAMLLTAVVSTVNADPVTVAITKFTLGEPAKLIPSSMGAGPDANAFYNPDMGYTGWSHSSGWGYVALKKGLPVTIEASTADAGFHPGIAVWLSNGKAPLENANGKAVVPGSYEPWLDYVIDKLPQASDPRKRSLKFYFVTNGVDRDSWEDPSGASVEGLDNSLLKRIPDGDEGKVKVTFTPPVSGNYVFVVGGIHPDAALGASTSTLVHKDVNVSVTQN